MEAWQSRVVPREQILGATETGWWEIKFHQASSELSEEKKRQGYTCINTSPADFCHFVLRVLMKLKPSLCMFIL